MKTFILFSLLFLSLTIQAQITTPIIKAAFGVDADLRANYFNGFVQSGNDDWFNNGTAGTGRFVIDTTGAAAIRAGYTSDVSPYPRRMSSFYRGMSMPSYSVVNNRMWLDALFVRDYHGNDTTVFTAGSDKNGMSPQFWSGGIQGIPDKNDILDMFMHVRRAGPTTTDSLWFFGGLSLDNVTGNRYFDFEMYQTDINYDRATAKWYGYGPDAGHTSWQFDAAGNITRPGDIIFSAEYQSSSLTNIEARIWVDRASLSITPAGFNWSGQFDGANTGSQFGYASILPKTGGTFYTGLQSGNGEWAGPFSLVLQDNSVVPSYGARQFMEFSVNLTKLGLDPVTVFGSDVCGTPFNRIVVKTRASASFTAELKDFVAPIDLFLAPRVQALADVPIFCGVNSVSYLEVQNPSGSSVYSWTTPDGRIVGPSSGPAINVDTAGTYIVTQRLSAGCSVYATDTVVIIFDSTCTTLESSITSLNGKIADGIAQISWTTNANASTDYFEVMRSFDGINFTSVGKVSTQAPENMIGNYSFQDDISSFKSLNVYYKLKIGLKLKAIRYSKVLRLGLPMSTNDAVIYPNPANEKVQIAVSSDKKQRMNLSIFDLSGALIQTKEFYLDKGANLFVLETGSWKTGTYVIQLTASNQTIHKKLSVQRQRTMR